jgi:hypothetical protein
MEVEAIEASVLKKRITMRTTFTVHHNEHSGNRPFEEVVNAPSLPWDRWKTVDFQSS